MRPPVVLVAPDKFRGSLTGPEAAAALARGVLSARPDAEVVQRPVADGGEGTVDAFVDAGWDAVPVRVTGPTGQPVDARYARRGTRAVVELAECCGVQRLAGGRTAPRTATSRGAGEALVHALRAGAREVVLGLGGSASTDGGIGVLTALGATARDATGRALAADPAVLHAATELDRANLLPQLRDATIIVATDVENPLLGPTGAAAVFGPQKGASPGDVEWLTVGLEQWATVLAATAGHDVGAVAGGGAAGGVAAGLVGGLAGVADVRVVSGAATVVELVGVPQVLERSTLVLTGEGSFDAQSLAGKAPVAVVRAAVRAGVPVGVVAGRIAVDPAELAAVGVDGTRTLTHLARPGEDPMRDAAALAARAAAALVRELLG